MRGAVQVSALLPKLADEEYSVEPGLAQLAAMAREEPASLGAISGFRVARRGIGAVRWLEPTDVRRLDVNATVRLSRGSVEVGRRSLFDPVLPCALHAPRCFEVLRFGFWSTALA
jgi:hypothetical protein